MGKQQVQKTFQKANKLRKQVQQVSRAFLQQLLFMEYNIRKQLSSFSVFSICGNSERTKFVIDDRFQTAFMALKLIERVEYYYNSVEYAYQGLKSKRESYDSTRWQQVNKQIEQQMSFDLSIKKGWHWEKQRVRLVEYKLYFQDKITVDFRNYLLRESKSSDKKALVLQAIRNIQVGSIRIAFESQTDYEQYYPILRRRIQKAHFQNVIKMAQITKINQHSQDQPGKIQGELVPMKKGNKQRKDIEIGDILLNMGNKDSQTNKNIENMRKNKLSINTSQQTDNKQVRPESILHQILKSAKDQNLDESLSQLVQKIDEQHRQSRLLIQSSQQNDILLQIQSDRKKLHKNLIGTILPEFRLSQLSQLVHFNLTYTCQNKTLFIYQHTVKDSVFKMQQKVRFSPEEVIQIISDNNFYKFWHDDVAEGDIKMNLSSDNSIITYQKHKRYSQWYRDRDFLFVRHLFKLGDCYYLVDKSIENSNFFPFHSITRGEIRYAVWKIERLNQNFTSLLVEIQIDHGGLLKSFYQNQLTIRYLKGFQKFQSYYNSSSSLKKLNCHFDIDWYVDPDSNEWDDVETVRDSFNDDQFENVQQISVDYFSEAEKQQVFYTMEQIDEDGITQQRIPRRKTRNSVSKKKVDDDKMSQHQVQQADKQTGLENHSSNLYEHKQLKIQLRPDDGLCILPNDYLSKKHITKPLQGSMFPILKCDFDNFILKDNWVVQGKGALKLIHKKKIQAQNNVFSFIVKTLKKNILSGKGMTGVSLPVQIFNVDSMLQRFCYMYSYGPYFIQKAAQTTNPIERAKLLIPFFITTSVVMTDPEKPFNPILGETYQAIIGGCPIYSQQISHHPPITATLLIGRGYRLHSAIEQKVNFQINTVFGINQGWSIIDFDDGSRVMYSAPMGGMQGMTYGERKLVIKDKGYYVDPKNKLMSCIKFEEQTGLFGKSKWKYVDQVQGSLLQVTEDYIDTLTNSDKKKSPSTKQIIKTHFQVDGRWTQQIRVDGQVMLNYLNNIPYEMQSYPYPISSNSTYREDLIYRQKLDIARSQIEKQRLQNVQRHDRKMRQKFHPTKH